MDQGAWIVTPALQLQYRRASPLRQLRVYVNNLGFATFTLFVLLPTLFAGVYYAYFASSQYAVEVRFAVRVSQLVPATDDVIAKLSAAQSDPNVGKETYVVSNFISSRNIIRSLDRDGTLRGIFSRPEIDYFSRFNAKGNEDELWNYSQNMLISSVDRISGVITLRVLAFSPQEALSLAQKTMRLTEQMVNQYSERTRADTLKASKNQLADAVNRYRNSLLAIRSFRDLDRVIDPMQEAVSISTTLLEAQLVRAGLERDKIVALRTLSAQAPTMRVLQSKIDALNTQIEQLQAQLTSTNENKIAATAVLARFEELELNRMFAEKLLAITQQAFQKALVETERQHMYLVVFVEPRLPDEARFPRRAVNTLLVFVLLSLIWTIVRLVLAGVVDARS